MWTWSLETFTPDEQTASESHHGPECGGPVSEQREHEQADRPEGRIFPAAVLVGEGPAVLAVHEDDGAEDERHEQQRHPARLYAQYQQRAASDLGRHVRVGEPSGHAQRLEE